MVHTILAGLAAGTTFAAFQMAIAASMGRFGRPIRMIAAMAVGTHALQPSYPLVDAAVVVMVIHLALSVAFALAFTAIIQPRLLARSSRVAMLSASVFGTILWIVNFYMIAPVLEWTWFPDRTVPLVQWVAHTFFFGAVLGAILSRAATVRDPRRPDGSS